MDLVPGQLRPLASAYRLSQLIHAFASLGLADALVQGPTVPEDAALTVGARPDLVRRLLRAAASEGMVTFADGRFGLNDFSRQLASDVEGSVRDYLLGWSILRPGYVGFAHLDEVIRSGKSGVEIAFGERFHTYMRSHGSEARRYEAAMESTVDEFREVVAGFDFSRFSTIVDVGGGQGSFLVAILEQCPEASGVLFDLPDVVAGAPKGLAGFSEARRISIVGGDMFDDVPAGGDAYVFSTVLRCFNDHECLKVLGRCRERMVPGGHILALEMVMEGGIPASPAGLADLQALVVYGGQDRTEDDWKRLFAAAGLSSPTFHPVGAPYAIVDATLA